jgi:hypothetical protein
VNSPPGFPTKVHRRKSKPKRIEANDEILPPIKISLVDFEPTKRRTCADLAGCPAEFLCIEDSLAERDEFELPVPICEQSDDSIRLSFAKLMTCFFPGYDNSDRIGSTGSDQVRHTRTGRG